MSMQFNASLIILGLLAASVAAYILTKINKKLGAWVTVAASFGALICMYLMQGDIDAQGKLWMLTFKLTEYGWFFSVIMLTVFACVSFFNIYWMKKIVHPAAYNMLYLLALMGTIGAFTAKDFIGLFIFLGNNRMGFDVYNTFWKVKKGVCHILRVFGIRFAFHAVWHIVFIQQVRLI